MSIAPFQVPTDTSLMAMDKMSLRNELHGALEILFDAGQSGGVARAATMVHGFSAEMLASPSARRARDRKNRDKAAPMRRSTPSDDTLVIVLHNGDEEIERGMAPAGDAALGVALMMLARRGELRPGDTLQMLAPD